MAKSAGVIPALLALLAAGLSGPVAVAAEKGGVFLLPVEAKWPASESAATIFEERLTIALGEEGRMRAVTARDIPASKRSRLPKNLADCTDAECIKTLGEIMAVDRVLLVRLANDSGRITCFSTVYDGRTGGPAERKEWPGSYREPGIPARLPTDIARWTRGEQPPPAPTQVPPAAPKPGLLMLGLAKGQADTKEARALLDELAARLRGHGGFEIARSGTRTTETVTHRGVVAVEHMGVTTRQHHVRHYREGALHATLTITDAATGTTTFSARGQAKLSEEADEVTPAQALGTMVSRVVDQWLLAFGEQRTSDKLRRK